MKKIKKVGSIVCLLIVVIAIQAVSGGGIGLDIDPENIEVELGSTATYNITVYNYQNQIECFDITVIPESCDPNWFDWRQNGKFICISRNEQRQVSLNVTPNEEGVFKFTVNAHSSNALKASQEVWITVNGSNQSPVDPSLSYPTPNGDPELAAGTAIKFTASAFDPDGDTLYYQYRLKGPSTDNSWVIKRDWNADNTWIWKTDTRDIGNNNISMWIRDTYHALADSYDLEIICDYRIIENKAPYNPTLSPNKPEPQVAGTSITWTASATDPDGCELYYRFLLKGSATEWTIMQGWSTDNTWTWNTSDADVGDTNISVWILGGSYDLKKLYYNYTIKPAEINKTPCYGILVPTREEPQPAGTSITWVAYAEDPDGDTRYYRFWIKGPATSNSWVIKQDWSTNNIWVWDTTAADIGNTNISVWIRDGHHAGTSGYDLEKKVYSYLINLPTVIVNEVELNPPEDDRLKTTMEWIELYNPTSNDINLSGWTLSSTQYRGGKTFEISGTIKAKGYYVFEHSLWLHNTKGESVILRDDDGTEIDRTPPLKDDYNDDHTWQRYPNLIWDFRPPTKGYSNGG